MTVGADLWERNAEIFKVGRRDFDSIMKGDPDALNRLFECRSRLWRDPSYEREIEPSRLFSDFACKLHSQKAFTLLPVAVRIALAQNSLPDFECSLWLIWKLADSSQTTELPEELRDAFVYLDERSKEYGLPAIEAYREVLRHYRVRA